MSALTLLALVRKQIADEGPQFGDAFLHERYINREINSMNPSELLERISNALVELQKPHDQRRWI